MRAGLLLARLYTAGFAVLFVLRAEAVSSALPHYARAERWAVIGTPIVVTTHMALACLLLTLAPAVPTWAAAGSAGLFGGGMAFWIWARRAIGPMGVPRLPDEPPIRLRRDGPFSVVRNPLYLGLLVMGAAPLVVVPRLVLVATWLLAACALGVRAVQDERRLHVQLGDAYAAYCREVPRLVPFIW